MEKCYFCIPQTRGTYLCVDFPRKSKSALDSFVDENRTLIHKYFAVKEQKPWMNKRVSVHNPPSEAYFRSFIESPGSLELKQ